jgi:hypothetical protein
MHSCVALAVQIAHEMDHVAAVPYDLGDRGTLSGNELGCRVGD